MTAYTTERYAITNSRSRCSGSGWRSSPPSHPGSIRLRSRRRTPPPARSHRMPATHAYRSHDLVVRFSTTIRYFPGASRRNATLTEALLGESALGGGALPRMIPPHAPPTVHRNAASGAAERSLVPPGDVRTPALDADTGPSRWRLSRQMLVGPSDNIAARFTNQSCAATMPPRSNCSFRSAGKESSARGSIAVAGDRPPVNKC